ECAYEAPLRNGGAIRPLVRVVDRNEVRVEKVRALQRVRRGFEIRYRVTNQTVERNTSRERVGVEIQQRLSTDVPCDVICDIDNAVVRVPGRTLGVAQNKVLIRVTVSPDIGFEIAPSERRELES